MRNKQADIDAHYKMRKKREKEKENFKK